METQKKTNDNLGSITIKDYSNYELTQEGKIWSRNYNKYLKPDYSGEYLRITLCKGGKTKRYLIHRLVATHFVSNPDNKPCVNHIDGDKRNNHYTNLEWVTQSENVKHGFEKLGRVSFWKGKGKNTPLYAHCRNRKGCLGKLNEKSIPIEQTDMTGNHIRYWDSISDAARFYDCSNSMIVRVCKGQRNHTLNYKWRYK